MWAVLTACPAAPAGSDRDRILDLASCGVRRERKDTGRSDPQLTTSEGPESIEGLTRPGVAGDLCLEQDKDPRGTVGGPHGEESPIVLAERQGPGRTWHGANFPTRWRSLCHHDPERRPLTDPQR